MWLITPRGMFSTVKHHEDPDLLTVRTRVRADAEVVIAWVAERRAGPPPELLAYQSSDYPWRVWVHREEWAAFVSAEAEAIDYANFKDEVTRVQGKPRHDIYAKVWSALLPLEKLGDALKGYDKMAVRHPRWGKYRPTGNVYAGGATTYQTTITLDEEPLPVRFEAGVEAWDDIDGEEAEESYVEWCEENELDPEKHRTCDDLVCMAGPPERECVGL